MKDPGEKWPAVSSFKHFKKREEILIRPFIRLDSVTLSVGGQAVFENTNWNWESGQSWAIIGPNGSGKSILAEALCHRIQLLKGNIRYFFHNAEGEPFFEKGDVVIVSPGVHQELMHRYVGYYQARWESLEEGDSPLVSEFLSGHNIEHVSSLDVTPLKTPEEVYLERRSRAVKILGIGNLMDRRLHMLSNGEARKAFIVRALIQAPRLLILDDPFEGLDAESIDAVQTAVTEIIAAGETRVLLTLSEQDNIPEGITNLVHVSVMRVTGMIPAAMAKPAESQDDMPSPISTVRVADGFSCPADYEPSMGTTLMELKNVSVSYNDTKVLSGIDWKILQSQRWALLGPNGAGKTTLLSLIMADNPQAYANEIYLFGRRRGSGESIWEIKSRIGWMSPELQLYYRYGYNCMDVICSGFFDTIGLYRACTKGQRESAMEWLKVLGLKGSEGHPFHTMSAGEQRLTLLGRALVKSPELLVLDEPCQGLDKAHRSHINKMLDGLCEDKSLTMIYVTHHLDELPNSITHVMRLKDGQVAGVEINLGDD
jgi:molybdate transport system ATP-binding protein